MRAAGECGVVSTSRGATYRNARGAPRDRHEVPSWAHVGDDVELIGAHARTPYGYPGLVCLHLLR